jgi:hypothetical protein
MNAGSPAARDAWALIEVEKRRDRLIRRVCIAAWAVTVGIVLLFAAFSAVQVAQFVGPAARGDLPWAIVFGSAMPFIVALWTLSLLVATLATVGVFLRFRTSSLTEIQLRLAALEDMLASRPDAAAPRGPEVAP